MSPSCPACCVYKNTISAPRSCQNEGLFYSPEGLFYSSESNWPRQRNAFLSKCSSYRSSNAARLQRATKHNKRNVDRKRCMAASVQTPSRSQSQPKPHCIAHRAFHRARTMPIENAKWRQVLQTSSKSLSRPTIFLPANKTVTTYSTNIAQVGFSTFVKPC